MKNILKKKRVLIPVIIICFLGILLLVMKIISAQTHDPSNPRSLPNSYLLSYSVEVGLPVEKVFDFITYEKKNVWNEIAEAHKGQKYEIINSDGLKPGAELICEEYEGGEGTSHHYIVKEVIENRLIYYASEPSRVYMEDSSGKMKEVATCNCHVYFDFEELRTDKTRLTQTLVIQMPNFIFKFITDIIGAEKDGEREWDKHLKEELTGLVRLMLEANT
jgi:hypothetical protein